MMVDEITHKIIGCSMKVHNTFGNGFHELIYQRSLEIELQNAGLAFESELEMPILYETIQIGVRRIDLIVEGLILVELKAIDKIDPYYKVQTINHCEAFGIPDGLLINFGGLSLEFNRVHSKKLMTMT